MTPTFTWPQRTQLLVWAACPLSCWGEKPGRRMRLGCGGCRQALVEFGEDATVSFRQPDAQWLDVTAGALLPHRFSFPER